MTAPKRGHYGVVVIGAGPAGLAATATAAGAGLSTLLLDENAGPGGQGPGEPSGQVAHHVAGGPAGDRGWRVPGAGTADPFGEKPGHLPVPLGWAVRQRHR